MMEKTAKRVVLMVIAILVAACAWLAMTVMTPQKAYAADLTAGKVAVTTLSSSKTLSTQSTSSNPYPDVTIKSVGKNWWKSIKFVKAKGGYKGVIKGTYYKKVKGGLYKKVVGKFQPYKKITKREFLVVLGNLYGAKVPVTYSDVKNANSIVTGKYACNKLVALGKKLGIKITWKGKNVQLTRGGAADYISVFAHFDKAFMPK